MKRGALREGTTRGTIPILFLRIPGLLCWHDLASRTLLERVFQGLQANQLAAKKIFPRMKMKEIRAEGSKVEAKNEPEKLQRKEKASKGNAVV